MKSCGDMLMVLAAVSLFMVRGYAADSTKVIESTVQHPAWSRTANIYEVNVRQFTREGTFKAFEQHLPRLKELGVDMLWFMPIHPIGKQNRKGSLGSYYSVQDYLGVNPEFGSVDDFKRVVKAAHAQGMHVIIDWVANHCAWDNPLATTHPEWFTHDSTGKFVPPVPDWHDVIDFNYDQTGLRLYMIDALKYWVRECDVDGFRCDVAGMVPIEFWNAARAELDKIKPVFMLAEDESPLDHEHAFDMTYSWSLSRIMYLIAQDKRPIGDLEIYFTRDAADFPPDAYRMVFTDNHDENSWNGTSYERLGKAVETFAVLILTAPGMPLIYNGQEAGLNHRLSFFEKDSIAWKKDKFADIYQKLLALKKENPALGNGQAGGAFQRVKSSADDKVFAYQREKAGSGILVLLNFANDYLDISLPEITAGEYRDVMSGSKIKLDNQKKFRLKPYGWKVFEKR